MSRAAAIALCLAVLFATARRREALAQHRAASAEPAPDAARCAPCHAEIVRQWQGSLHRQSFTDDVFARSFARETSAAPFCLGCHAPLGERSEGISCAVCHGRDEHVVGSGAGRTDGASRAARDAPPHATRADASFATSAYCARCHQFDFPLAASGDGAHAAAMQDTFREWAGSAAAARGAQCQDCHMPWADRAASLGGGRYRRHDFPGVHDPAMLASAVGLELHATRGGDGVVRVTGSLRAAGAAHRFPTGDLFRRVELRIWLEHGNSPAVTIALERTYAFRPGRRFDGAMSGVRRPLRDTRLDPATPAGASSRPIAVAFPDSAASHAVGFALEYLLMPDAEAALQHVPRSEQRIPMRAGSVAIE